MSSILYISSFLFRFYQHEKDVCGKSEFYSVIGVSSFLFNSSCMLLDVFLSFTLSSSFFLCLPSSLLPFCRIAFSSNNLPRHMVYYMQLIHI